MDLHTLATITGLALVDSVNPCTIAVMALLLSAVLITKGRRDAILAGILFTATIYAMYLLYGLGILTVIYSLGLGGILRVILKALLVIMIIAEFSAVIHYSPGFRSMEMPLRLRPIAKRAVKSAENPWMAIPIAALCSVLLLPCSSGPYLSAILLLANSNVEKLVYLLYYNVLFVIPMIGIVLLIGWGTKPEKVMEWREKHMRTLHLVAGILLLAVFCMV